MQKIILLPLQQTLRTEFFEKKLSRIPKFGPKDPVLVYEWYFRPYFCLENILHSFQKLTYINITMVLSYGASK